MDLFNVIKDHFWSSDASPSRDTFSTSTDRWVRMIRIVTKSFLSPFMVQLCTSLLERCSVIPSVLCSESCWWCHWLLLSTDQIHVWLSVHQWVLSFSGLYTLGLAVSNACAMALITPPLPPQDCYVLSLTYHEIISEFKSRGLKCIFWYAAQMSSVYSKNKIIIPAALMLSEWQMHRLFGLSEIWSRFGSLILISMHLKEISTVQNGVGKPLFFFVVVFLVRLF